jgi:hypothetical protein
LVAFGKRFSNEVKEENEKPLNSSCIKQQFYDTIKIEVFGIGKPNWTPKTTGNHPAVGA